ncbi:hypothetical protein WN990_37050 [Kitasatospora purpeofusca]|uniref:hypothetical protein n=1 Tax=Kitasatospora purpeofusca TaxID=67352 RepID=UPI0030F36DB3
MTDEAFEELTSTGEVGPHTLELLRRLGRQAAHSLGVPPPEDYSKWDQDAVDDVLAQMLDREDSETFIVGCVIQATDPASLERLFFASIRYFLIDQAKMTDRGKLRRRFASRLTNDSRFVPVQMATSPGWTMAAHPDKAVWQGDLDELIDVAYRVRDVRLVRWNTSGPTPADTVHAMMAVLTAVLDTAGGAVREEDLAKVLEARFVLLQPLTSVPLFASDGSTAVDPVAPATDVTVAGLHARAQQIWDSMTPQERAVLHCLHRPPKAAAAVLGVGPAQARAIMDGLKESLRLALADDDAAQDVLSVLLQQTGQTPS